MASEIQGERSRKNVQNANTLHCFFFLFFFQVCHSKSGEVDASKVANLVKAYVDKYKHIRKNKTDKNWGRRHSAARTSAIPPQEPVFHRPLQLELLFISENSNDFSIDYIIFV